MAALGRPPRPPGTFGRIQDRSDGAARVRYTDPSGKEVYIQRKGRTPAESRRLVRQACAEYAPNIQGSTLSSRSKFSAVAELYLEHLDTLIADGKRAHTTRDTYRSALNGVLKTLGEMRLAEVTAPVVDSYMRKSTNPKMDKVVITNVMALAIKRGAYPFENPGHSIGRIERKTRRKPVTALTSDQWQQWIDILRADKQAAANDVPDIARMMLATACRIGELLAIGWPDVDFEQRTVNVAHHMIRATGVGLVREIDTKTSEDGVRLLELPKWAVTLLKERYIAAVNKEGPVFPNSKGKWREPNFVERVWKRVSDESRYGITPHIMRKTTLTHLAEQGVNKLVIASQAGHSTTSTADQYYVAKRAVNEAAVEALNNMF